MESLYGLGEAKLLLKSKSDLVSLCQERGIPTPTRATKNSLIDQLIYWKRRNEPPVPKRTREEFDVSDNEDDVPPVEYQVSATGLGELYVDDLKELCRRKGLSTKGTKDVLVTQLYGSGVAPNQLSKLQLYNICVGQNLSVTGNIPDLIERLKYNKIITKTRCRYSPQKRARMDYDIKHEESESKCRTDIISKKRMHSLLCDELKELCRLRSLSCGGPKAELVDRLYDDRIELKDLCVVQLKEICSIEELRTSGNKTELIERLKTSGTEIKKDEKVKVHQTLKQNKILVQGKMSTNTYRIKLRECGLLEEDQDVFHIIARKNGGADHSDNYHYAQNQAFNRAIGYKFDHVNCYLAGKDKARKAVAISKELCGYNGKSADELYRKGESFWRNARLDERNQL